MVIEMKIVKIITIIFCIMLILPQNVFALGDVIDIGESFMEAGKTKVDYTMDTTKINEASSQIYNILLVAATVVAIVVGAFLGLQYMTAGIDKKVQVKESLFPYLISCIVVFGSLGIWKLAVTIMNEIK